MAGSLQDSIFCSYDELDTGWCSGKLRSGRKPHAEAARMLAGAAPRCSRPGCNCLDSSLWPPPIAILASGPQAAHHRCRCRRHPPGSGAHRHQEPTGKPDPGPKTGVGCTRRARQLRRSRANLILHVRAASAAPIRLSASEAEDQLVWTCLSPRVASRAVSLIHVCVPASITVYYRALSRVYRPGWSVLDGHP